MSTSTLVLVTIYHTWQRLNCYLLVAAPLGGSSASTCEVEYPEEQTVDAAGQFGEGESSLRSHEAWLLEETKKPLPNEKEIEARMEPTAQRRLAGLAKMSVREVKQPYPYLMDSCQVNNDLETLVKGKDIRAKVRAGIDRIANLAQKKLLKCKEKTLRLLLETSDLDTERLRIRPNARLTHDAVVVRRCRRP
ncbi:hypothetical protein HPB51_029595 [Rhipicephalus microplus]|uniref:Uncharacterized protein n=1 Tax=Rhipicephalus microplus TaxID=6941 RepID=A0A9J6CTR3_RHIMP|nr:hypothetical protein HPB51_029595 [Rhipicephalus microplus]